ncbi:hypothetical protein LX32DRAFT_635403 [Colletotrichum zoysiae]|uniref:Cyanovirin-N domain-containing protein n=1 Tax=Colletotrichum zoysiae TaxID=1216348 RepID=A0AAD9HS22_9PEZI|nr:hypothetical protein LX32DRAFT_635403 [Colletotrichum zoysiae]
MQLPILLGASFVAVAAASLPPINLGYFAYDRTNEIVAWSPFTPTTTQELLDVCNEQGPAFGTKTWTTIRAVSTIVNKPLCRNPFNVTDVETNTTYYDLELACADEDEDLLNAYQVTAVVDRATNKPVETCVQKPLEGGGCTFCGGFRSMLCFDYVCTSV